MKEVLVTTVVVDPHMGKTVNMVWNVEEPDIGQIEYLTVEKIKDLGFMYEPNPVFVYYDGKVIKAAEYGMKKFDNLKSVMEYVTGRKIFCRFIARHKFNGKYALSVYDELDKAFNRELSDLVCSLNRILGAIVRMKYSKGELYPDTSKLMFNIMDAIENLKFSKLEEVGVGDILRKYETFCETQ